eukprot:TRINITY_DN13403_c0_g1_i1.p1 TRINITY_DN13403_c0_g1~~TRINITY_DN13403_c0_g1_i1.p1  ORF type:complete len:1135 (-),score=312.95 TRINITY_DN13403_c0_g1_i1:1036-4398(-)
MACVASSASTLFLKANSSYENGVCQRRCPCLVVSSLQPHRPSGISNSLSLSSSFCSRSQPLASSKFVLPRSLSDLQRLRSIRVDCRTYARGRGSIQCGAGGTFASPSFSEQPSQPQKFDPSSNFEGLFGREKVYSGVESFVRGLSSPFRTLVCGAIVLVMAALGSVGGAVAGLPFGQVLGAVLLGALGAAAARALDASRKEIAAKELHNLVVRIGNPETLRREQVEAIAAKYGVTLEEPRFIDELKDVYGRYLEAIIPQGATDSLGGHEVEAIKRFKGVLGLDDDDAAAMHMEVGRRIQRQRLETGSSDRETNMADRKVFQRLVYVSNLVFGPKAKFLLPWKRAFKLTDAQVDVSVDVMSRQLLQAQLDLAGAEPDVAKLRALRQQQLAFKVTDERAEEMFQLISRKHLEGFIHRALEVMKARARVKDTRRVVQELDAMIAYSSAMGRLSAEKDIIPGVTAVTVAGGEFDVDRGMDDLKTLYSTYLAEALTADELDDKVVDALSSLRNIFGMGVKEAEAVESEVTGKVYYRRLSQAVQSGALDAAPSKALFLEDLCDRLRFDPEKAFAIHEDIYRKKLEQCLADNSLSDEDVKALQRLRVLLCVPQAVVDKASAEICGKMFTKVVDEAISAGVDGYDADMKKAVQEAVKGLRLPVQAALDIAGSAVRAVFLTFAKRARSAVSRTEAGRELKKMVMFSNLAVSQLLDDIRQGSVAAAVGETAALLAAAAQEGGQQTEATSPTAEGNGAAASEKEKEEEEQEAEDEIDEELQMLQTLRKTRGAVREGRPQKEINLRNDLELRERADLYERFLAYAIQGETTGMPMGTTITVQKDDSDYVRLSQLGDILGLSPGEVAMVHQDLAEKAFKQQAQTLLADGQLSATRMKQLKEMQTQLGLPDAPAQKVIQTITSSRMSGEIESAIRSGRLTVDDIRELKTSGTNIEAMISKPSRVQIYKKLVQKEFSAGTGAFEEEELVEKLPVDLGLDPVAMKAVVVEMARERKKGALVQAMAFLRQRQTEKVAAQLKDLLACDKADRQDEALAWPVKEELLDLYAVFVAEQRKAKKAPGDEGAAAEGSEESRAMEERLCTLLGIDGSSAEAMERMVDAGGFTLETSKEEDFVF